MWCSRDSTVASRAASSTCTSGASRWTTLSAERMFAEVFPAECVQIRAHGNVLTSVAFLHGLVVEELRAKDFEHDDPAYELSICIRAVKPAAP